MGSLKKLNTGILLISLFLCFARTEENLLAADLLYVQQGQQVPFFQIGMKYKLSDDTGKVRIIYLFRAGQRSSERALEDLGHLSKIFQPRGVKFIGIAVESESQLQALAKKYSITFPLISDPKRSAFDKFGVVAVPSTCLIDQNGFLAYYRPLYPNNYHRDIELHLKWLCGEISKEDIAKHLNIRVAHLSKKEKHEQRTLNMARRLWDKGRKAFAMMEIEKLQKEYPNYAPAFLQIGVWELLDGHYQKAIGIFQNCQKKSPKNAILGMAIANRMLGKRDEAKKLLAKANGQARAFYELGRLNEKSAQVDYYKKAYTYIDELKKENEEISGLYNEGVHWESIGNIAKASVYYRKALEISFAEELITLLDPLKAKLEWTTRKPQLTKVTSEKTQNHTTPTEISPDKLTVISGGKSKKLKTARRMWKKKHEKSARRILQRQFKKHPDDFSAALQLGFWKLEESKNAEAKKIFEKCLSLHAQSLNAYLGLMICESRQGDISKAQTELEKILLQYPKNPRALYQLGLLENSRSKGVARFKKALEHVYGKYQKKIDRNTAKLYSKGKKYAKKKKFTKAYKAYRDCLKKIFYLFPKATFAGE